MQFTLPNQKEFIGHLKKIKPFMSKEETRYYLCGIFCTIINNELHLVATDGHRLLDINTHGRNDDGEFKTLDAIIPAAVINTICSAKGVDANLPLVITFTNLDVQFNFYDWSIKSKLIDGTYPDFQKIVPDVSVLEDSAGFNSGYIIDALKAFGSSGVKIGRKGDSQSPQHEPILIKGSTDDIKAVLMPMRI
jgi:DNA polymerase III sliding clamp (beta) subunit (PCNA family)